MEDIKFINETYDIFEKYGCNNKEEIEDDLLLLDAWLMRKIFDRLKHLNIPRIRFSREGNRVKYGDFYYDYDDCAYQVEYEIDVKEEDFVHRYNVLGEEKIQFLFRKLFKKKLEKLGFSKYYTPIYGDYEILKWNPFEKKCIDKRAIEKVIFLLQEFWCEKFEELGYLNLELIDSNKDLIHSLDFKEIIEGLDTDLKINFIYSDEAEKRDKRLCQVLEKLRELGMVFVITDYERFLCERFRGGGARKLDFKLVRIYIFLAKEVQFGNSSFESYSRS